MSRLINESHLYQSIPLTTAPSLPRMRNRPNSASFVDNVKHHFEHDPQKYERFLDIMRDLKEDVIGPAEVLLQIAALFNGYPDLAREFNAFLPPGYLLHPRGEGRASHILLSTPEGTTTWPQDYARQR